MVHHGGASPADDLSSSRSNNIREDSHKSLNCRIDSSLHCLTQNFIIASQNNSGKGNSISQIPTLLRIEEIEVLFNIARCHSRHTNVCLKVIEVEQAQHLFMKGF